MAATRTTADAGVEGNARLTGVTAVVLLIALAVEGFTVIDVGQMVVVHIFVGMLLVPVTVLKMASTGWRFTKYYRRVPAYRQKGPPHTVLRILAPLVVISSVALLGTGVGLLVVGSSKERTLRDIHQITFVVWAALMTVHVLGHLAQTYRLSRSEFSRSAPPVPRAAARRSLVMASVLVGLALGVASLSWNSSWTNRQRRSDNGLGRSPATLLMRSAPEQPAATRNRQGWR